MFNLISHTGETVVGTDLHVEDTGLLHALTHQPLWISLLIIAFVLFGVYQLLEALKLKPLNRVLAMVPLLILIAILYLKNNPAVTTVVLSVGFVVTFVLAFSMMSQQRAGKQQKTINKDNTNEPKVE